MFGILHVLFDKVVFVLQRHEDYFLLPSLYALMIITPLYIVPSFFFTQKIETKHALQTNQWCSSDESEQKDDTSE